MKVRWQSHIFWLLVLLGHGVFAVAWWGFMPQGFPVAHPRFWVNTFLPWAAVVGIAAVVLAAARGRLLPARIALLVLAAAWVTAGIYGRGIFPISFGMKWLLLLAGGVIIAIAAADESLRAARLRAPAFITGVIAGMALAVGVLRAERGEEPSTHPLELTSAIPADPPAVEDAVGRQSVRGGDVKPETGVLVMQRGPYVFYLQPMMDFVSRSEDRCWTCFSPAEAQTPIERKLSGFASIAGGVDMSYQDAGRSWLSVRDAPDAGFITVEATTKLAAPIFSHLNNYAHFEFAGHRDLTVMFSPCADQMIEVTHSDYPMGSPLRFACLDADGTFSVREAASGEKGPFKTLAAGKLKRGDPLTITLIDQQIPMVRVTLSDWSSESSTALSPTAGWGVPANAIEFSREKDDASSTASFFVTLAGTSVGRGWDSVGHAAGIYRNRIKIEWVDADEAFGKPADKSRSDPNAAISGARRLTTRASEPAE